MQKRQYLALKQACAINDKIFSEIVHDFHFKTEHELALFIRKRFREHGVKPAYPPIVANNNQIIHPKPRKKPLQRGWLLFDFGCKVGDWCSDMSRTVFLGKATKEERGLYEIVRKCQAKCVRFAKPGITGSDLDIYSRVLLGKYKPYMRHALGHGVSKKIHDSPRISVTSPDVLKTGHFFTIEPGIYFKTQDQEVGIRIEDTLVMHKKKPEVLTLAPKHFIAISFSH
ncbi:MAG: M24 family metallopeptidase [Candidatus Woesearchaeota archaeon]|nr:M24 family metallopeptidase [Candidatus Woesearchaeota archaeon]